MEERARAAGERAVRDNINSHGSLVTGGESKQQFIRKWLKEKNAERILREQKGFDYARWTFYVAVGALIAAMYHCYSTSHLIEPSSRCILRRGKRPIYAGGLT